MLSVMTISAILFSIFINYNFFCTASEHTFGYSGYGKHLKRFDRKEYAKIVVSDHEYFHKEVTHNRGNGLKNYTLIFNFIADGDGIKEVTYVKIDIPNVFA